MFLESFNGFLFRTAILYEIIFIGSLLHHILRDIVIHFSFARGVIEVLIVVSIIGPFSTGSLFGISPTAATWVFLWDFTFTLWMRGRCLWLMIFIITVILSLILFPLLSPNISWRKRHWFLVKVMIRLFPCR